MYSDPPGLTSLGYAPYPWGFLVRIGREGLAQALFLVAGEEILPASGGRTHRVTVIALDSLDFGGRTMWDRASLRKEKASVDLLYAWWRPRRRRQYGPLPALSDRLTVCSRIIEIEFHEV